MTKVVSALCGVALLLVAALFFLPSAVEAEGNCPPGYYPIGGQGVQGCAPIPNYNGGGNGGQRQSRQPQQPPRPTGYWEKTWGALAPSPKGGVLGTATGASSKEEAERRAMADCKAKGGQSCAVRSSFYNQCGAIALGSDQLFTARAGSEKKAEEEAIAYCRDHKQKTCRAYFSVCTEPIFHQN